MKNLIVSLMAIGSLSFMIACGGGQSTDVVESGTYNGKIAKVKPGEKEIYVKHKDHKLELYFTDSTKLMKGGKAVDFSMLQKDQKVSVKVEKMGKKLNPLEVTILE